MSIADINITKLHGVGSVKASQYRKIGIVSVADLLTHYPRGYEDRGNIKLIGESDGINKSAYLLTVATQPKSVRVRGRMSLTKFRAYDDSGVCDISFFNQEYLKNTFVLGSTFRFYGKVEKKAGRFSMVSPAFEPWDENAELPALMPVYPLTEGISQKQIVKDIRSAMAIAACDNEEDTLPEEIRRRQKLCLSSYALKNIHNPENFVALAAAKKRLIFEEFFNFALGVTMMGVERKRADAYPCKHSDLEPLENILPYKLTDAQRRVIGEIDADMSSGRAMSRLLIGDVGSGKTVCAAASILFAVQSGKQAALMAPTEILARQHYESLCNVFSKLGIRSELLLGATTVAEKKRIYAAMSSSGDDRVDVVIGTQALLSAGVEFDSLGLAVVDEQHRFGVAQRAEFSRRNPECHILVMSATPIPRSFALALYGDLDISLIDQMPAGRQRVDTFVVDESYRERLNGFIRKQILDGGQVYVVCPSVDEAEEDGEQTDVLLESVGVKGDLLMFDEAKDTPKLRSAIKFSEELAGVFPEFSVDFIHGKLKSREKEDKMQRFVSGQTQILVSTTVIEVGVNVPNATLMIVENAERFGLSQLHQLRGRVGRGNRKSYCILVSDMISRECNAKERLMTLKNLYDGYAIAEKDLAMRGPGDFLRSNGAGYMRQSGGIKFKLAELCDDMGLMSTAFEEARELLDKDPRLSGYPELLARVEQMFTPDADSLN